MFGGKYDIGVSLLERALAIAEEIGDDEAIAYPCMGLSWHYSIWTFPDDENQKKLKHYANRAIECGGRAGLVWVTSKAILSLCADSIYRGHFGDTRYHAGELIKFSEQTSDPRPRGMALFMLAFEAGSRGDFEAGIAYAEDANRLLISPIDKIISQCAYWFNQLMTGKIAEARPVLKVYSSQFLNNAFLITRLYQTEIPLAFSIIFSGELKQGVRYLEDTMTTYTGPGNPHPVLIVPFYLGKFYFEMATSKEKPAWEVVRKNALFLMTKAPFARKLPTRYFLEAIEVGTKLANPAVVGEAHYLLDCLAEQRGSSVESQDCFAKARPLLERAGSDLLLTDINRRLKKTGT